jgi:predicted nucleotidyltransferase
VARQTGIETMVVTTFINNIHFPEDRIRAFCRRHGVARLSLFGGILRDRVGNGVDVLVEFPPRTERDFAALLRMQAELSEMIGHGVNLRTPMELPARLRRGALEEARPLHSA